MAVNENFPLALSLGTVLAGQYVIEKVLGQGGFGITYKANNHKTGEKVAVKEFFPDTLAYREKTQVISYPGERDENFQYGKAGFLQEAQTLAQFLENKNIVHIHSYFEENGTAYFVMDYIEGTSFDEYLKQHGGKISVLEAEKILIPIMDALEAVHAKGIIHRDVTPDNIYICSDGTVKLLDFGAARYSLGDKSRSLDVILKHGFAPKEQYTRHGRQGSYTDIYSLAATFYFAITGRRPPDSVDRLEEDDLIPPSSLGIDITDYQEEALFKALEVQPQNRFASMSDFKNVLLNENSVQNQAITGYANIPVTSAVTNNVTVTTSGIPRAELKPAPVKKKISGKMIAIISAVVVLSISVSVLTMSLIKKDKRDYDSSVSDTVDDVFFEDRDKTTDTPVSDGNVTLLGNTNGNLLNGGFVCPLDGQDYYYADPSEVFKSLIDKVSGKELFHSSHQVITNLCHIDNTLYFLCDGKAWYLEDGSSKPQYVDVLSGYGDLYRMYITEDYYFISVLGDSGMDGTLYRVSKSGECEDSMTIDYAHNFTICDGYIYYVYVDKNGTEGIIKKSVDDLSGKGHGILIKDYSISYPMIDNGYLYVMYNSDNERGFYRLDASTMDAETASRYELNDIITSNNNSVNDYSVKAMNVYNNNVFFELSGDSNINDLYHITITNNEANWTLERLNTDISLDNISIVPTTNGEFEVHYVGTNEDEDGEWIDRYICFDSEGKRIE